MRRVGEEAALLADGLLDPHQHAVDGDDEGANLGRQTRCAERAEILIASPVQFGGEIAHRFEHAADDVAQHHQQDGNQDDKRHQRTQSAVARSFVAYRRLLADDKAPVGSQGGDEEAPGFILDHHRLQPVGQFGREPQWRCGRARRLFAHVGQHLHHHLHVRIGSKFGQLFGCSGDRQVIAVDEGGDLP